MEQQDLQGQELQDSFPSLPDTLHCKEGEPTSESGVFMQEDSLSPSLQEWGGWDESRESWYFVPNWGATSTSLSVRPMPDNLSRNDIVGAVLTAGLLLLLLVLGQTRRRLRKAVTDFLFPVACNWILAQGGLHSCG